MQKNLVLAQLSSFLTCRHLEQCRCHYHVGSPFSTLPHTSLPLKCNMPFRFPPEDPQHIRPHTWHMIRIGVQLFVIIILDATSLQWKTSLSQCHFSSPFWNCQSTHRRLPHQKHHTHSWTPPCGKRGLTKCSDKCSLLESSSVFVPVVVHRSAVAILQTILPTANIDPSATEGRSFIF